MGEIFTSIILILSIIAVSLGGMFLVRRSVSISSLESHHEVAGFVYAVVGVLYAVIIGFIILSVWEQFIIAQERFEDEATKLASVYRNSLGLQDSTIKAEINSSVNNYVYTMVNNELPAMKNFKTSEENRQAYLKLWNIFYNYHPENSVNIFWYDKTVDSMKDLLNSRKLRIMSIDLGVPFYMWVVLIMGSIITIGFTFLFGTKKILPQALIVISLSGMIGLSLILVDALDHPYSGIIHIKSEAFKMLMQRL